MYLAEIQWALLDPCQRPVYRDIVQDNYGTLLSLDGGTMNPNPQAGGSEAAQSHKQLPGRSEASLYLGQNQAGQQVEEAGKGWSKPPLPPPPPPVPKDNCNIPPRVYMGSNHSLCLQCGDSLAQVQQTVAQAQQSLIQAQETVAQVQQSLAQLQRNPRSADKLYPCVDCGKSFGVSSHLTIHRRIHTDVRRGCEQQDTSVAQKMLPRKDPEGPESPDLELSRGRRGIGDFSLALSTKPVPVSSGDGRKPYKCMECGKGFGQSSHLMRHLGTHSGEKPYRCADCPKAFTQLSNLRQHQRMHTGERPYACDCCDKRFSWSSNLAQHRRLHTGQKPYACIQCGKCFCESARLLEHQRTHTGERPYACPQCRKRFSRSSHLARHQRLHATAADAEEEDQRPYPCSQGAALRLHHQTHCN